VILLGIHPDAFKFQVAEKVVHLIRQPMLIQKQLMIHVGVSIGVADFDGSEGCTFDYLLEQSDKAMYEVKREGKNGYAFRGEKNKIKIEQF